MLTATEQRIPQLEGYEGAIGTPGFCHWEEENLQKTKPNNQKKKTHPIMNATLSPVQPYLKADT